MSKSGWRETTDKKTGSVERIKQKRNVNALLSDAIQAVWKKTKQTDAKTLFLYSVHIFSHSQQQLQTGFSGKNVQFLLLIWVRHISDSKCFTLIYPVSAGWNVGCWGCVENVNTLTLVRKFPEALRGD